MSASFKYRLKFYNLPLIKKDFSYSGYGKYVSAGKHYHDDIKGQIKAEIEQCLDRIIMAFTKKTFEKVHFNDELKYNEFYTKTRTGIEIVISEVLPLCNYLEEDDRGAYNMIIDYAGDLKQVHMDWFDELYKSYCEWDEDSSDMWTREYDLGHITVSTPIGLVCSIAMLLTAMIYILF